MNKVHRQHDDIYHSFIIGHYVRLFEKHRIIFTEQFNFIYFGPKQGKDASIPLIVIPHGGPHSNYVDVYSFDFSIFVSAGDVFKSYLRKIKKKVIRLLKINIKLCELQVLR